MNDIIFTPIRLGELELLIQKSVEKAVSQIKSNDEPEMHFKLPEAAAYCKMAVPTFRTHLAKRNVTGSKPGKSWIFQQSDLDEFLQKFRQKTRFELRSEMNNYVIRKNLK